ncbi:thermonuclease family protein [Haladaptatus halobius]|uniref:thermonuclease family protein n=1 Tax=Haladaptatus halobius TaxID=2884875 RepID=UPI001D0A1540|nr:thermonuclease family protein [Haladaptatus halobius]
MHRSLPAFSLILLIVCAGCLGGLGFGGSSETPMTTTTNKETQTQTTVSTTTAAGESTTATTTTTETQTQTRTQTTSLRQPTTARIDTPEGSDRFQARVTTIIDPTTIKIKHDGTTQIVELIGVSVPENGTIQKQALCYTNSQLDHQVVTVVTDPQANTVNGHMQAYVYIGAFMFNTDLVRIGYARVPDGQFSKRQQFLQKQQQAKQNGSGRWNTTTTTA